LSINDTNLTLLLDSLVKSEKKCLNYDNSLIWTISITEKQNSDHLIEITMQSEINKNYDYLGFFYIDKTFFIVMNKRVKSLFSICNTKKTFSFKNMIIPSTEDYSVWVYNYAAGILTLQKSYILPCR
jgi:hypothetical protein